RGDIRRGCRQVQVGDPYRGKVGGVDLVGLQAPKVVVAGEEVAKGADVIRTDGHCLGQLTLHAEVDVLDLRSAASTIRIGVADSRRSRVPAGLAVAGRKGLARADIVSG